MKCVLVIAGSDSSGGAGVQADIKTISSLGAHAFTVITAVTVQNSLGIRAVHRLPAGFIIQQAQAVIEDFSPDAVKIGMIHSGDAVKEVVRLLELHPLPNVVLDPLCKATAGGALAEEGAYPLVAKLLLPLARVVTPNMNEAEKLANRSVRTLEEAKEAAVIIKGMGPDVVITGGHMEEECVDLLYDGQGFHEFHGSRIRSRHTHGSGCVFSSALATFLSMGRNLADATGWAKAFTRQAILDGYACGSGNGPVRPPVSKGWNTDGCR